MPVDEETRHDVYEDLKRVHGAKRAGAMMEMMPPAGVPELATKADIGMLKADLDVLRSEMDVLRAEMAALEARLEGRVDALRADLREAMHDQTTRYIRWMLTGMTLMGSLFAGLVVVSGLLA